MNRRNLAHDTGAILVPAALVVGASLTASAIGGLRADRDHYRAEAGRPRPTVTQTTVEPVVTRTTVTPSPTTPAPSASPPSARRAAGTVLASGQPRGQTPVEPAVRHPGAGAPSGPSPTASSGRQFSQTSGSLCSGVVAVQLLRSCVSLGGGR